jgi:hypothetical protein
MSQAISSWRKSYHAIGCRLNRIAGFERKNNPATAAGEISEKPGVRLTRRGGDGGGDDGDGQPQMRPGWQIPSEAELQRESFSWDAS